MSKYILIDGQQRITTLLLMLAAMRNRARHHASKLADKIDDLLLKNRHQDGVDIYKLLPTQADRLSFCSIMDDQAGRNRQILSSLAAPASVSARKSEFRAAALRLRAMLSLRGCCLSKLKAIFRNKAKFSAALRC
ncbi:MAG: DUF262 domain-containing protein [Planctomycetes bacterium]|nr:DUF262 domain-containing protein [Planctomycetota bacterium]